MTAEEMVIFWAGFLYAFSCLVIDELLKGEDGLQWLAGNWLTKIVAALVLIVSAKFLILKIFGS